MEPSPRSKHVGFMAQPTLEPSSTTNLAILLRVLSTLLRQWSYCSYSGTDWNYTQWTLNPLRHGQFGNRSHRHIPSTFTARATYYTCFRAPLLSTLTKDETPETYVDAIRTSPIIFKHEGGPVPRRPAHAVQAVPHLASQSDLVNTPRSLDDIARADRACIAHKREGHPDVYHSGSV